MGISKKGKPQCVILNPKNRSIEHGIKISGYTAGSLLKECSLFISNESVGNVPFRIKVYDSKNGKPAILIVMQNIIVDSYTKGSWNSIDLSGFNILLPNNEFFIGVEWLITNNNKSTLVIGAGKWSKTPIAYTKRGSHSIFINPTKWCIPYIQTPILN